MSVRSSLSGVLAERAVAPERFAMSGRPPELAVRPRDRDELCELVRAAARDGLVLVPWGGGVALQTQPAPPRYELAIDLGALDRVVEYEAEDLTLTAECGATLGALANALDARGQELPLETAHASRAMLGGVLAANASGPRRLRLGAPRDRILGARFLLGDGTMIRTGGKVVKNVAGYGIHRLLCGSRGGLAILVEASLKLLPQPGSRRALIYECDVAAIADAARWSEFPRREPAVLTVVGRERAATDALPGARGGEFWMALGFEDDPPRVAELADAATAILGKPAAVLEDREALALWRRLADLDASAGRVTFTSAYNTPDALSKLPAAERASCVFHAPCGRLHVFPQPDRVQGCATELSSFGFALIEAAAGERDLRLPAPVAIRSLRKRIRTELDPGGRFALGEQWEKSGG